MFWGRDIVFQTRNGLLQLALVSDQTHQRSSKASLKSHCQQAAEGVRPAETRASKRRELFIKFITLAWRPSAGSCISLPSTVCTQV